MTWFQVSIVGGTDRALTSVANFAVALKERNRDHSSVSCVSHWSLRVSDSRYSFDDRDNSVILVSCCLALCIGVLGLFDLIKRYRDGTRTAKPDTRSGPVLGRMTSPSPPGHWQAQRGGGALDWDSLGDLRSADSRPGRVPGGLLRTGTTIDAIHWSSSRKGLPHRTPCPRVYCFRGQNITQRALDVVLERAVTLCREAHWELTVTAGFDPFVEARAVLSPSVPTDPSLCLWTIVDVLFLEPSCQQHLRQHGPAASLASSSTWSRAPCIVVDGPFLDRTGRRPTVESFAVAKGGLL